jgi:ribosomal protein S19
MQRVAWKLPYTNYYFFSNRFKSASVFFTRDRRSTILNFFIKKKIKVYSGKSYITVNLDKSNFIGYNLGDFSFTKIRGSAITQSLMLKGRLKAKAKAKNKNKKK